MTTETRNLLAVRQGDTVILNYNKTPPLKRKEITDMFWEYQVAVVWVSQHGGPPVQVSLVVRQERAGS